jgi:hypothetical protein
MRIAVRYWQAFGAAMLVLIPFLLFRAGHFDEMANISPRHPSPANNVQPARPRGLLQQELLGINPDRLILYTPPPADAGDIALPRR